MKIEDVLLELQQRDDDRAGDEPGAAGPAAGRATRRSSTARGWSRSARPKQIFTKPAQQLTYDYVTGNIG